ncbi:MAG: O-methyltransferase [Acidimicrobiales bacterium]
MRLTTNMANQVADRVLTRCVEENVIPSGPWPDWHHFLELRRQVRSTFEVPESSITPLMARVLYGVSCLAQPRRILGVGTYVGNALVWLVGAGFIRPTVYIGELAIGIDIDAASTLAARENFVRLGSSSEVRCVCADGHDIGTQDGEPWDLVFIDADDPVYRKGIYLSLLDSLYPSLTAGGLLLAHDISVPKFRDTMVRYRHQVSDRDRFESSIALPLDEAGIEISRKAIDADLEVQSL